MKTLKIYFALLALFLIGNVVIAQTDTLKLSNVSIIPETHFITNLDSSYHPISNDTMQYKIVFKLSDVSNTDRIFIKLGTATDGGQLLSFELIKQTSGNVNFFNYNGQQLEICADRGYCIVTLVKPPHTLKFLTIYAKGANGVFSDKKYVKF